MTLDDPTTTLGHDDAPDDIAAALREALTPHRQEHNPSTGYSRCAHGDWEGPFTIHNGPGSFSEHLTEIVLAALSKCAAARALKAAAMTAPLRPALPGPGMMTDAGWLPLGPPRWQDLPDWVSSYDVPPLPDPTTDTTPDPVSDPATWTSNAPRPRPAVRHDHDEPIIGCRCAERYGPTPVVSDDVWDSVRAIVGGLAKTSPTPPTDQPTP